MNSAVYSLKNERVNYTYLLKMRNCGILVVRNIITTLEQWIEKLDN